MEPEGVGLVIFLLLFIVGAIIGTLQKGSEETPDIRIEGYRSERGCCPPDAIAPDCVCPPDAIAGDSLDLSQML